MLKTALPSPPPEWIASAASAGIELRAIGVWDAGLGLIQHKQILSQNPTRYEAMVRNLQVSHIRSKRTKIDPEFQSQYNLLLVEGMAKERTLDSLFSPFGSRSSGSSTFAFSGFRSLETPPEHESKEWEAVKKYRQYLNDRDEEMEGLHFELQRARHAVDELSVVVFLLATQIQSHWSRL
jgi:hypothetical protein